MTLSDDAIGMAIHKNVVMFDVRGALEIAHIRKIEGIYTELVKRHGQLVLLCVARRALTVASPEARAEGAVVARKFRAAVMHMAVVIEDDGVVAELFRTLLRVFSLASRFTHIKIYDSVESAAQGIAPMVDADAQAEVKREVVRVFRRLHNEWVPVPAKTVD
jgi:hypothetical protein